MTRQPDILCIGSVLWDIIGRTELSMAPGADQPGHIVRVPGGVALNIALTLRRFGLVPALLSVVGDDPAGRDLVAACTEMGLDCAGLLIDRDLPTDTYMAIEAQGALVAALADARSLEAAGARILAPLTDGRIRSANAPWAGPVALDSNLTDGLLAEIAEGALLARADLRVAPASPGKADRVRRFIVHPRATLYVNREEAGLLAGTRPADAAAAAAALLNMGARRVLVTAGADMAVDATPARLLTALPPQVEARRITGAGDTFMAAHIAAELAGEPAQAALERAVRAAAAFVSETME